jgi:hypothetical protein
VKLSLEKAAFDTIEIKQTGWNENLASDSEAIIKAELATEKPIEVLQKETIEIIQKKAEVGMFPMEGTKAKE